MEHIKDSTRFSTVARCRAARWARTVCTPAALSFAVCRALVFVGLTLTAVAHAGLAQSKDYVIGPRDVLGITVWSQVDLSGKYTVSADGTFTFPLIGTVKAGGLTLKEVEADLRKRLADGFFQQPQLSVAMEDYRSQRIFVIGQVRQPGSYPLTGSVTLIEALARAGSTTAEAAPEALIVRADAGKAESGPVLPDQAGSAEVIRININELQSGAGIQTVTLNDGDTVFIPRAETVFVSGQVRTPGAYPIATNTTVLQVITLAGGATERAATNRIRVIRADATGNKQEVRVKQTDVLRPGDTVVVPERFF